MLLKRAAAVTLGRAVVRSVMALSKLAIAETSAGWGPRHCALTLDPLTSPSSLR